MIIKLDFTPIVSTVVIMGTIELQLSTPLPPPLRPLYAAARL